MADSDENIPVDDFDFERVFNEYRAAYEAGDPVKCLALRDQWKAQHGDDDLHVAAYGEP